MEVVTRCKGCAVGLLPGTRVVNTLGGGSIAPGQNCTVSITFNSRWMSTYVGLRAQSTSSRAASFSGNLNLGQLICRPQTVHSGRRSLSWRAGGIEIPNPIGIWEGVKNPLLQSMQNRGLFGTKQEPQVIQNAEAESETRVYFSEDRTIDATFPKGELSTAAIDCIEQFSRLNGLSGKQMRSNFQSSAPTSIQNNPRNLVEFTCFRYLARCNADFHPSLMDATFRRLTFSTMLAWQRPYKNDIPQNGTAVSHGLPRAGLVGEEAFIRIAPAIAGAADRATAHGLYQVLQVGENDGISFDIWDRYCSELCKVQKGREQHQDHEGAKLGLEGGECVICVVSDNRQPVQKWTKTNAWPGRLTLTDRALYFEANGLTQYQKATRLDITGSNASVEKRMVGPFGVEVFNSAISVSSSPQSEPWVLEFVDFSGEKRRNAWLAMIREIFSVYSFMKLYGVEPDDPLVNYVYGAEHGQKKALGAAMLGIVRLQAVQAVLGKLPAHPERLLQFSYLANLPSADLILQALAVAFWGGRMEVKSRDIEYLSLGGGEFSSEEAGGLGSNLLGTDGTVYLRNWATSPSWKTGKSGAFWRAKPNSRGLVLGKNHVVGGLTQVERAVEACRDQASRAEKTQATIDGALLKGVPDNIDLLQELLLPFSVAAVNLEKLKRWENPGASVTFLFFVYGIIYMNWVKYAIPSLLLSGAAGILTLRVLKSQGKLQGDFGKVTIREQPPTNAFEKVMALKEAINSLEKYLQTCNIALLKLRTVALSREPRVTNEVLMTLVGLGVAMLVVPFRYLLAMVILDQFTNELKFREKSVKEMFTYIGDWWSTIPAAPVVVLPPEKLEADVKPDETLPNQGEVLMEAMSEWLGEDGEIT